MIQGYLKISDKAYLKILEKMIYKFANITFSYNMRIFIQ